jgi:hypothetical protein
MRLLLARAAGFEPACAMIAGVAGARGRIVRLAAPSAAEARRLLGVYADVLFQARTGPMRLVERTSFAWALLVLRAEAGLSRGRPSHVDIAAAGARAAEAAWWGDPAWSVDAASMDHHAHAAEADDARLRHAFGEDPPFRAPHGAVHPEFERRARAVWGPLIAAMEGA